jgi:hypothetical protein
MPADKNELNYQASTTAITPGPENSVHNSAHPKDRHLDRSSGQLHRPLRSRETTVFALVLAVCLFLIGVIGANQHQAFSF